MTGRYGVHVRPAWDLTAAPLSDRAAELLVAEWLDLGLIDAEEAEREQAQDVVNRMQVRAAAVSELPVGGARERVRFAAEKGAPKRAEAAPWPTLLGRMLTYGETCIIGRERNGAPIKEQFNPGSLEMPADGGQVLLNRGHDRSKVIGHVTGVTTVGSEVRCRGILVDTTTDGRDALELARAGSVNRLSIEFIQLGAPHTTVTRTPDGGLMVRHNKVLLTGLGIVPVPAYKSARLLSLLDRTESGRQGELDRERARMRSADRLNGMTA